MLHVFRSEPSLMIASRTNGRFLIFLTSLSNVFYRIANEALINAGYLTCSHDYCNAFLFKIIDRTNKN
ncbi:hypothetical protein T02_266 [Trichinella nativa]|uniref:Uncharacterized protein n=1 Tax=Trichinella nativa TaxID=6335 RepID=A0A0V1KPL9_9BILA|nr:hypothetical protein T02_266 [Trichinella nativa]